MTPMFRFSCDAVDLVWFKWGAFWNYKDGCFDVFIDGKKVERLPRRNERPVRLPPLYITLEKV